MIKREIKTYVVEGVAGSSPTVKPIVRNSDIYELKLAEITVRAGTQQITQADILDTRLDSNVCGVVTSVVKSVDTTQLFNQYETYLNQKIAEWNATKNQQTSDWENQFEQQKNTFDDWYNDVRIDITKLQSFNFDNLAELKGTTRTTQVSGNRINEVIKTTSRNTKVAERLTEKLSRTSTRVTTKVYERNGIDIIKQTVVNTNIDVNNNNTVSEVVL